MALKTYLIIKISFRISFILFYVYECLPYVHICTMPVPVPKEPRRESDTLELASEILGTMWSLGSTLESPSQDFLSSVFSAPRGRGWWGGGRVWEGGNDSSRYLKSILIILCAWHSAHTNSLNPEQLNETRAQCHCKLGTRARMASKQKGWRAVPTINANTSKTGQSLLLTRQQTPVLTPGLLGWTAPGRPAGNRLRLLFPPKDAIFTTKTS